MRIQTSLLILALAGQILAGGCRPVTLTPSLDSTMVEKTVVVRLTQYARTALPTSAATATAARPTFTPPPPTATLTPTSTSTPTFPPPTATATPSVPCNAAQLVAHVTYPDGVLVSPNQVFRKTWRLRNVGSCTWTREYALIYDGGDDLHGPDSVQLSGRVRPGDTVDLSVNLVSPRDSGEYTSYWLLSSPEGDYFGLGVDPFWVKIKVAPLKMDGFRFVDVFCTAAWTTQQGGLVCPSLKTDYINGSVQRIEQPKLEGGYTDNEPALVMAPNDSGNGWVRGRFPAFMVESGDHLVAQIGCLDGYPRCSVTFRLSYTIDGENVTELGSWNQDEDGVLQKVDLSLSTLAGQPVQFIFTVSNRNAASVEDVAFWLNPQIKRPAP